MFFEHGIATGKEGFYNVTGQVAVRVRESGVSDGLCVVYVPHTTAGVVINETGDPDVVHDLLLGLRHAFPDRQEFRHAEGNSRAHLKSAAMGASVTVIIKDGKLLLGTWQAIYFCEFDGPRQRKYYVKIMG